MNIAPSVQVVLETMRRHDVKALLMGGQACVVYGASEFTRDVDFAILADDANLEAVAAAMRELDAVVIAVPPFDAAMLRAGHAVHFRCRAQVVAGLRVDLMSQMRGVDAFALLWERRRILENGVSVLALPDLVAAKKTQRDKDWPMIRRLVEADYLARSAAPDPAEIIFWLRESRTPAMIQELVARFPSAAAGHLRSAVRAACNGAGAESIADALQAEQAAERAADAEYWKPLKRQLEQIRHQSPESPGEP